MNHTDFPADRVLSTRQLVGAMRRSVANGQRFCFILGSGISAESGIPTGQTLATRWMACLMGEQPDLDGTPPYPNLAEVEETAANLRAAGKLQYDFEKIKALWAEYRGKPGWEMPSEYYFDLFKIRFFPRQQDGFYYLEQQMEGKEPSFGYHPLALMLAGGHSLAITTNFDSLLEDALYLYTDSKPLVINHEVLADYISRQQLSRPIIAKVHRGLFFDPLNSPEDTSGLRGQWQGELKAAFHTYTPIVIGYGGGDHSLMDFLRQPDTRMPRGLYWCYWEREDLPKNPIRQMVEDKGGCFVSIAGFDALMLAIGNALYPDKILAHKTAEHLQARTDLRIQQYEKTLENAKETAHTQSGAENADFQAQLQALDQREQKGEARRERQGQLTPWDHFRRGNRHYDAGEYDDAITDYNQAIDLDSNIAAAYYNRGVAYTKLGKYAEAIADYDQAITLDPQDAAAYNNRGIAYRNLGKYAEAIADCTQAIALDPKYAVAYSNRGDANNHLGKYAEAIADCTQAITLDSKYAGAYNNRGIAYGNLGKYTEAIADYTQAIVLDPKYAVAYCNRGDANNHLGKYAEAIADCTQAITLDSKYAGAYNNRGNAHAKLGKYAEAIADYDQAIALDPKYAAAYNNRGYAYANLGKYAEAIADYTQAIALDPKNAAAYNNRGLAYDDLGKYAEAIADYDQAIALDPKYARAYHNRGIAYADWGKYPEAIVDYSQAIALDPKYAKAYNNRGVAHNYLKQYPAAVEDFTKAIELAPTTAAYYLNRAEVYRVLGQEDNAKADEEQAQKLGGQNSSALG